MATGAQHKSFMSVGTLYYKLNNWVTLAFEQSLYETNAVPQVGGWHHLHVLVARVLRAGCCKHFRPAEKPRRGSFKRLTSAPAR
jgi:hypothetical protein